jgi:hypothetical protein
VDNFVSLESNEGLLGDNIRNSAVDTDSFHNIVYNVDLEKMIADSDKERKELISKYGKCSPQVIDRWFLCEDFDRSSFPKEHPCYDDSQKKWFDKLKLEHADQLILVFVSPMPKLYVDILEEWEDSMITKGIPKKIKELQLNTELYEECILSAFKGEEWKPNSVRFNTFRIVPHNHEVVTVNMEKKRKYLLRIIPK